MYSVNLTRKFRRAALIALPLALMACGTDSITGVEPSDASLAKKAGGGGKLIWTPAGTYYNYDTQSFHYQTSSLSAFQSFSISVTAQVSASYDCAGENGVVNSFDGVSETIVGQVSGQANKKGQASGVIPLGPSGSLRCGSGTQPINFAVLSNGVIYVVSDPPNPNM
ncbi:MAG TPA: hypothetical protein VFZ56_05295 [Gemmatimonadaceae bacterium]